MALYCISMGFPTLRAKFIPSQEPNLTLLEPSPGLVTGLTLKLRQIIWSSTNPDITLFTSCLEGSDESDHQGPWKSMKDVGNFLARWDNPAMRWKGVVYPSLAVFVIPPTTSSLHYLVATAFKESRDLFRAHTRSAKTRF